MCKVAMVSKITDKNRSDVWVFMEFLGQLMSPGNNDGLGYAAVNSKGKIFGEKWLINESAFKDLTKIPNIDSDKLAKIYSYFGDEVDKDDAQAIILHTRAATCTKGIKNTHPFINDEASPDVAIIHNGWVHNEKKFTRKYSTCDSEVLAHLYQENGVASDLGNLNKFLKKIEGWYTVLALSTEPSGRLVMDAFSDNGRLASYYIQELDTRIYSSSGHDVWQIARALGLTAVDLKQMSADTAFRIDVLTGEQLAFARLETATSIPVRVTPAANVSWEGWENIKIMEGSIDDEEFHSRYFGD